MFLYKNTKTFRIKNQLVFFLFIFNTKVGNDMTQTNSSPTLEKDVSIEENVIDVEDPVKEVGLTLWKIEKKKPILMQNYDCETKRNPKKKH